MGGTTGRAANQVLFYQPLRSLDEAQHPDFWTPTRPLARPPSPQGEGTRDQRESDSGAPDFARTPLSDPDEPRRRAATAPPVW